MVALSAAVPCPRCLSRTVYGMTTTVFYMMFDANGCFEVMLLRCPCSTAHVMAASCVRHQNRRRRLPQGGSRYDWGGAEC